ncbi:hypothetical protein PVAP13_4KG348776 [Panicum virgatum]|uniref:Uncharacterized protein n=1 Tax=Panicum virgatum TaxID=38727 RepID=A0A8T0TW88_PANVG|nr:hypothetical protein PVAP13_4KG348776 [Panicum virgatum]
MVVAVLLVLGHLSWSDNSVSQHIDLMIMDSWDEEVRRFMLEEEEEDHELFFVLVPALQLGMYDEKEPEHTSVLTGPKYVKEVLEGHERWCKVDLHLKLDC